LSRWGDPEPTEEDADSAPAFPVAWPLSAVLVLSAVLFAVNFGVEHVALALLPAACGVPALLAVLGPDFRRAGGSPAPEQASRLLYAMSPGRLAIHLGVGVAALFLL